MSSQTNTSLFCTLCPHSCAPGKNFPVGHPSPNFSGPSMLNLGVLWRPAYRKKLQLVGMGILLILLSLGPGFHTLGHVPYVQCQRPMCHVRASSANGPCATSVRPVPMAYPRCSRTDPPHVRPHAGGICAPTHPCSCPRTYARTCP